jgi:hypothetical protein
VLPGSVAEIGAAAFSSSGLSTLALPSGLGSIAASTFASTPLTSISIPDTVTNIGDSAFFFCAFLGSVTLPAGLISIGDSAFYLSGLASVTLPDDVISIGDGAFESCGALTRVSIGKSVTTIGDEAFAYGLVLSAITVAPANPAFLSLGGALFDKPLTTLIQYPLGSFASSYSIPNGAQRIGDGAFGGCSHLRTVTVPNGVTNIGNGAFSECLDLSSVSLPGSLTSIGTDAFSDCNSLLIITIPPGVAALGDYAFGWCSKLKDVYFQGNAPSGDSTVFQSDSGTAYYLPGTTGWGSSFGGLPTALWTLPSPLILNHEAGFGAESNGFAFTVSWATNLSIVVEASPSLASPAWTPVATNTLMGGQFHFSDSQWTNYAARFYRVVSQ